MLEYWNVGMLEKIRRGSLITIPLFRLFTLLSVSGETRQFSSLFNNEGRE
jgi:hypothetical protein